MSMNKDDSRKSLLALYEISSIKDKGNIKHHNDEINEILHVIEAHMLAFNKVKAKLNDINKHIREKMSTISENNTTGTIDILDTILQFTEKNNDEKSIITYLYKLNAFYEERVYNDKDDDSKIASYYQIVMFPSFIDNYNTYKEGLKLFANKDPIEIISSTEVFENKDMKSIRNKTETIIEKIYTRILYFKYTILHNHYVSILYMMYGVRQLRLLNNELSTMGKQIDYKSIEKKLSELLKNDDSSGTQNFNNKDMLDINSINLETLMDVDNKLKSIGGSSNDDYGPVLQKLVDIFNENKELYKKSNTNLSNFFNAINESVKENSDILFEIYKNNANISYIKNDNLRKPLKKVIDDVNTIGNKQVYKDQYPIFEENAASIIKKLNNNANVTQKAMRKMNTPATIIPTPSESADQNVATINNPIFNTFRNPLEKNI